MSLACSRSPSVPGRRWLDVYCKLLLRRMVCCGEGTLVPPSPSSRELAERPPSMSASTDAIQSSSMTPEIIRDHMMTVRDEQSTRSDDGSYSRIVTVEEPPRHAESELRHRVFLYGTLKQGQPNHSQLSSPTAGGRLKFVGCARSTYPLPLIVTTRWNLPFLLDKPGTGQIINGEVYDVDDSLLAWMDSFEGHPDVYERDVIQVELSPASDPSVPTSAPLSSCNGDDDAFCAAVSNVSMATTTSGRSEKHTARNKGQCSGGSTKSEATPCDVDMRGCGQDDTLRSQQQQQQQTTTCTCFVYLFKRLVPILAELENYASYDAFNIHGKPYKPDGDLTGIESIEQEILREYSCRSDSTTKAT